MNKLIKTFQPLHLFWIVAKNELYTLLHHKVFWVLFPMVLALMGLSWILASMSLGEKQRILSHVGITAIYLCLLLLSITLGTSRLFQEIESKRLSLLLISSLSRTQLLLGHYLGLFIGLFLKLSLLLGILFLLLGQQTTFLKPLLIVGLGIYIEALLLFLFASWVSQNLSPWLAVFSTLSLFLTGHWLSDLDFFVQRSGSFWAHGVKTFLMWTVPDLEKLNWRFALTYPHQLKVTSLFLPCVYALNWGLLFFFLSLWSFHKRRLL